MRKPLLALPLALAACVDVDAPSYPPQQAAPMTPVASRQLVSVPDLALVIATGGVAALAIDDPTSIGWSGDATAGFRVEPFDGDGWPNTQRPEYWVRALATGPGSFAISTNHGLAVGAVDSAPVARVRLAPADYLLDGRSPFALAPTRTTVQAVIAASDARRLVDATLSLGEATRAATTTTPPAWDRIVLSSAAGRHLVTASADSFAAHELPIDVDGQIDRTEQVELGDRTCFHAYHGNVEIVTTWTLPAADPRATNCTLHTVAAAE